MSYYELEAESKGYWRFHVRESCETLAHFHGSIEFLFVKAGEQEVTVDGERRLLKAGEACFCDSFSLHHYAPPHGGTIYYLVGEREYFEPVFTLFDNKTPPRFFRFENYELFDILYTLCQENRKNEGDRCAIFEGTARILLGEIAKNTPLIPRKSDRKNTLVCEILHYAENNLSNDLSLLTIARKFGYSHEYLSRILHRYLAENWNAYVNRLRARHADTLLKSRADASVLEIAYECGFESPNTFYRAYKKEFGKPPRRIE